MGFSAKVLKDSLSPSGGRLTTFEVVLPRLVLSEFNTHRVFSRNSASSRAIPIEKRIIAVESDPFIPTAFGKNKSGMQASEDLNTEDSSLAEAAWRDACRDAVASARKLSQLGVHKQLANRILEPFCWHTIICTSTEWENYFALRCHPDAQPEIKKASELMEAAYKLSRPSKLKTSDWHLPLVDDLDELKSSGYDTNQIKKISVGRCARVSYLTHQGTRDPDADIALCDRLATSGHMSPFEHVARPMTRKDCERALLSLGATAVDALDLNPHVFFSGNFRSWVQFRKEIVNEDNYRLKTREEDKNK